MAEIYIPMFCEKELCDHAYLREMNAFEYILKDIHERFLEDYQNDDSEEKEDKLVESLTDLLEVSNTTNNIKLLHVINKLFEKYKNCSGYSIKKIKVYARFSPLHYI